MTTLTININENLKMGAQKKAKAEGFTVTALVSQFLKSYLQNEWEMKLSLKTEVIESHKEALRLVKNGHVDLYKNAEEITKSVLK